MLNVLIEIYEGEVRIIEKPKGVSIKIVDRTVSKTNPNIIELSGEIKIVNESYMEAGIVNDENSYEG